MKRGDFVTPKAFPELRGRIVRIDTDFAERYLYVLDNGCMFTKDELRLKPLPTKLVRIDEKTEIEVSIDIPDEVARARYLEKLEARKR